MGIDIEDEIVMAMSQEIQEEIDFGIMSTMLAESGWHTVKLSNPITRAQWREMEYWSEQEQVTARGVYKRGNTWLFKSKDDAIMFRLTWE
jgi:hypothetical protein